MGTYDALIQTPTQGQPISSAGYGIPVREAVIDLDRRLLIREANEALLPDPVSASGNGTNAVTWAASTWQVLPSNNAVAVITNPSLDFDLLCQVFFGAWILVGPSGSGDVRFGLNVTGGVVSGPGVGSNAPASWGMLPTTTMLTSNQRMGYFTLRIPAAAAAVTLTGYGQRSSATGGNQQINYPTIDIMPTRFVEP